MDLIDEIQLKMKQLDQGRRDLRKNGIALAQKERAYKEAVSKKVLEMLDDGRPVTAIDKLIYGLPSISTLRFERDCAEVVYDANKEAINITKLQLRILEEQLKMEYGATDEI